MRTECYGDLLLAETLANMITINVTLTNGKFSSHQKMTDVTIFLDCRMMYSHLPKYIIIIDADKYKNVFLRERIYCFKTRWLMKMR